MSFYQTTAHAQDTLNIAVFDAQWCPVYMSCNAMTNSHLIAVTPMELAWQLL